MIGAVSGDIRDIGKNLVATMLSVHRWVVDLGVNVPPMEVIDTAQRENPRFIALSSLMTTSMPYQRDVLELLTEMGVRNRFYVVLGGGPVTAEYASRIAARTVGGRARGVRSESVRPPVAVQRTSSRQVHLLQE